MLYDELWDIVDEAPADSTVHTKSVIDGVLESAFREAGTRYQDALKSVTPEGWTTSFLHSEAEVWAQLNMLRTNRDTVCAAKQALGQHDTDKKRPLDDADAETRRPQEDKRITPTEQTPDETAVQRAEAAAALFKKVVGGPPADQHAKYGHLKNGDVVRSNAQECIRATIGGNELWEIAYDKAAIARLLGRDPSDISFEVVTSKN